jgi:aminoglycoside phosphotransferase (APT) family kinase protein
VVVRQHGDRDLALNPQIAEDEFRLLQKLHAAGLAVPKPYLFDQSRQIFSTPYVVVSYIDGGTEFAPADLTGFLRQAASQLAKIHRLNCSRLDLSFLPRRENGFDERPATLDESLDEGHIRKVLEATWPLPQVNEARLLHGDFWPGNLLWKDDQLVAVIDWEDAAIGDPLADVANGRLEILWAFGVEAMMRFTAHYQALTSIDFTHLPYWDLCAALRPASKISQWGLDDRTEQAMRASHRWFITQAFHLLSK